MAGAAGYGVLKHVGVDGSEWQHGHVATPLGFVAVYSDDRTTTLRFIHNRREHSLTEDRPMNRRAIVRAAHQFAKEIAS